MICRDKKAARRLGAVISTRSKAGCLTVLHKAERLAIVLIASMAIGDGTLAIGKCNCSKDNTWASQHACPADMSSRAMMSCDNG